MPHFPTFGLYLAAFALASCNQAPPAPPPPLPNPSAAELATAAATQTSGATAPASAASGSTDGSVPAAASVLVPARDVKVDPTAGRTNRDLTRAQESRAMPLPGQNNDHSAPLGPAKRASG